MSCRQVTVGLESQLSVAVTAAVLHGPGAGWPHSTTASAGTPWSSGTVVSTKVMCCTQVSKLPQPSVAFQVRSMPALPVQLAAAGASVWVMVTWWSQLSVAVAVPVFDGSVESPHCNCRSAGQLITGLVVSTTVMVWL